MQKNKADGPAEPEQPSKKQAISTPPKSSAKDLLDKIVKQGETVRSLKAANAEKVCITCTFVTGLTFLIIVCSH